jgi:hypothetical protein
VLRRQVFGVPGLAVGDCESVYQSRFDHVRPDAPLIRRRSLRGSSGCPAPSIAAAAMRSRLAASWLFSSRRKALTLLEQCKPAPSAPTAGRQGPD